MVTFHVHFIMTIDSCYRAKLVSGVLCAACSGGKYFCGIVSHLDSNIVGVVGRYWKQYLLVVFLLSAFLIHCISHLFSIVNLNGSM